MNSVDVLVVGGGIAGLTTTAFTSKAGKSVMLIEKERYFGGLVNTFTRGEFKFDGGLRAVENSGIVFPMLRQLGIDLEFVKSTVTLGVGKNMLKLNGTGSIDEYQDFLIQEFPKDRESIKNIIVEIKKITDYMDVLYGIDNPIFLDPVKDKDYFIQVILPWIFKFIKTIKKIEKLDEEVNDYLGRFTNNMELIDNITQHFFKETPTSFALSYFALYNDYNYPIGGTEALPKALEDFSRANGAILKDRTLVTEVNPSEKYIIDSTGEKTFYTKLVWACDLKSLYKLIDLEKIKSNSLKNKILKRSNELKDLIGAESVFAAYLSVDLDPEYFSNITTGHCFYTPSKKGLSKAIFSGDINNKDDIKEYLKEFVKFNTFEIAIPCLRDPAMAPPGKTGVEISLLFDYELTKTIISQGWKKEFKSFMEEIIINEVSILFPKLKENIIKQFSSTPLTMERYTNNSHGAIVGWSFTNPKIPVVRSMKNVAKSVKTPIKDIYKCGQWAYSPAGMPISILTGKLAANRAIK